MARKPRFNLPGIPQPSVQRGNNREPCFFAVDDYRRYLSDLHDASRANNVAIHAYVLMTNHVHVPATPGEAYGITYLMQDVGRQYVRYIHRRYRRSGTLGEGRYKASLVDREAYRLACMRYIELKPVRAHRVSHPGEYRGSRYGRNAAGKSDPLIQPHPVYRAISADEEQRRYGYRELFKVRMDHEQIHAIRESLHQELVLGREDFKERIERMDRRQTRPGKPGGGRELRRRAAFSISSRVLAVSVF